MSSGMLIPEADEMFPLRDFKDVVLVLQERDL